MNCWLNWLNLDTSIWYLFVVVAVGKEFVVEEVQPFAAPEVAVWVLVAQMSPYTSKCHYQQRMAYSAVAELLSTLMVVVGIAVEFEVVVSVVVVAGRLEAAEAGTAD